MIKKYAETLAKLLLVVHGLVTLGYAGAMFFNPTQVTQFMGIMIAAPDGKVEVLTMYVGMSGVMGLFMLVGAFKREWFAQATLFLVLSMSGIAISRTLGFIFFETGSYTLNALFYDIPITLLSWVAYYQLRKTSS